MPWWRSDSVSKKPTHPQAAESSGSSRLPKPSIVGAQAQQPQHIGPQRTNDAGNAAAASGHDVLSFAQSKRSNSYVESLRGAGKSSACFWSHMNSQSPCLVSQHSNMPVWNCDELAEASTHPRTAMHGFNSPTHSYPATLLHRFTVLQLTAVPAEPSTGNEPEEGRRTTKPVTDVLPSEFPSLLPKTVRIA